MFFKSACCCLSLKLGTLVTGWLLLVLGFLHLVGSLVLYVVECQKIEGSLDDPLIRFLRFDIPVTILNIIGLAFLLYGAYKDRSGFYYPYLFAAPLQLAEFFFLQFYWFRYCATTHLHPLFILPGIIPLVTLQYFYFVLLGSYLDLESRKQEKMSKLMQGNKTICVV